MYRTIYFFVELCRAVVRCTSNLLTCVDFLKNTFGCVTEYFVPFIINKTTRNDTVFISSTSLANFVLGCCWQTYNCCLPCSQAMKTVETDWHASFPECACFHCVKSTFEVVSKILYLLLLV